MTALRKASGGWTAHLALIILLVQLFATGFTAASHAAAPQLDAFGNVLCLSGEPGDAPDGNHGSLPGCCTFGCNQAASAPAVPQHDTVALTPRPVTRVAVLLPETRNSLPGRLTHPGSPRAPPSAV